MEVYPLTKDLLNTLVKKEKSSENKELKIEKDSVLEEMVIGLVKTKNLIMPNYKNCSDLIPKKYNALDVQRFSWIMPDLGFIDYSDLGTMIYLEALINNCTENKITIYAKDEKINTFGASLKKKVIINGNIGNYIGCGMSNGIITVNGNVGDNLGFGLNGGKIIINGDAGNFVGYSFGGIIHLNGNYGSINEYYYTAEMYGVTIYHKGKLIRKKGKK